MPLWQALRVSAQRRGMGRAAGLDAPFVGRSAELRLVKDMFHASADEKRSRLVSVVGVAGIGKSRLSWEFEKYIDGLAADVWWHRGRCLSYGDGVAYWALAEMVRGRAKILEDEGRGSSAAKLRAVLEANVGEQDERDWIEPRLLQLLGLSDRTSPDREDLFSAWRRFFERLAEQGPLVMVFEDIHWADEGLVAFVEYLLDWGRHHPIFVVTLARPEVADRHPSFPGSMRSSTTLPLDPLDDTAMDELLLGLVPGLPDDVRTRLREAADGIPLYAVETVRMLRDRGVLEQAGGGDVVTGDLTAFEVPQSLQALITSRLDGVPEAERRLLQDASVLGKTFTRRGLSAISGASEEAIEPLVTSLVRKELLAIETDPFSPERGQLAFLQALVQRVTYETIARRDRRTRHLAAARFLSSDAGIDPDEIAEVIASHYLDAHEADPEAPDRDEVRGEARRWFTRAAERAASVAASLEAQRAFERVAGLAGEEVERGNSLARAGDLAVMGGRFDEAESLLSEAITILDAAGARSDAAKAQTRLAEVYFASSRIEESVALLQPALEAHMAGGDEVAIATVSTQLGRMLFFEGANEEAMQHVERALELGERLRLTEVVVDALNNKALILQRRPNESLGLMRQALVLSEETAFDRGVLRTCMNLSYLLALAGRMAEADVVVERGIEHARRRGDRIWEGALMTNLISSYAQCSRWDEAEALLAELPDEDIGSDESIRASSMVEWALINLFRGDTTRALELATPIAAWGESARLQTEGVIALAKMIVALAEDRPDEGLAYAVAMLRDPRVGSEPVTVEASFELGSEAAGRSADDLGELIRAVEEIEGQGLNPTARLQAHLDLERVRVSVLRGGDGAGFEAAVSALSQLRELFSVATAQLDHAESLIELGQTTEASELLAEARPVFERLGAVPRLERLERAEAALAAGSAGATRPALS